MNRALFAALSLALIISSPTRAQTWRSALYPKNWTPGFSIDGPEVPAKQRRMLQDFSYAGYHRGEKPIPANPPGKVYDITRFGAKPDDEIDDTAAIQNAIDAAGKAGGGIVSVPRGEFRIQPPTESASAALLIKHSGVVLRGAVQDGKLVSRLLNTSPQMRYKQVIEIKPPVAGTWADEPGAPTSVKLRSDALLPTKTLAVEKTAAFKVGDWVVVAASTTEAFIGEHGMLTERWGWKPNEPMGPRFCRRVMAINAAARTITIDIPTRYPLELRDHARIYKIPPPIQEVGIENLGMAMLENKKDGWEDRDYAKPGTGAYEVHWSSLIVLEYAANCWVRRVETYQPAGNTSTNVSNPAGNYHLLSYGIRTPFSHGITVADCVISNPQYRGQGGNGYPYVVEGSESLFANCVANNARHAFSHKGMGVMGNVIWRCTSNNARWPADFHMWLSASNLIDNITLNGDSIQAFVRLAGGKPSHGVSTSRTVIWNTRGLAYPGHSTFVIDSRQWGHGYVIGTRGPARAVQVTPTVMHDVETGVTDARGTIQPDWVEGAPRTDGIDDGRSGDTLEPASLYADQLERRLRTQTTTFDCRGLLHPDVSARELATVLGKANVKTETLHVGEGETEKGTVIFPADPARRLEIFWKDPSAQSAPRFIRVTDRRTKWRTGDGITIGTDLRAIETINGKSFTLYGFEWDYSGTTADWRGGKLSAPSSPCKLAARLAPDYHSLSQDERKLLGEVAGDEIYASDLPAMRKLNPKVYTLLLTYDE